MHLKQTGRNYLSVWSGKQYCDDSIHIFKPGTIYAYERKGHNDYLFIQQVYAQ